MQAPENYTISLYIIGVYFTSSNCEESRFSVNSLTFLLLHLYFSRILHNSLNPLFQVYENGPNGKLLFSECSYSNDVFIFSNSSQLFLRSNLNTDPDVYQAIDLYYLASDKGPGCGGELFNYAGIFTNPNYGKNERSYQECRWDIAVPQSYNVSLRFSEFDFGTNATCETNYVELIEVTRSGDESVVRKYCGDMTPDVYRGMRNVLSVRFKKTVNFAGVGFMAQFVATIHGK